MKREQQNLNPSFISAAGNSNSIQPGFVADQSNPMTQSTTYSCDKKVCGKNCRKSRTCESLAELLFNFRMIWGA